MMCTPLLLILIDVHHRPQNSGPGLDSEPKQWFLGVMCHLALQAGRHVGTISHGDKGIWIGARAESPGPAPDGVKQPTCTFCICSTRSLMLLVLVLALVLDISDDIDAGDAAAAMTV